MAYNPLCDIIVRLIRAERQQTMFCFKKLSWTSSSGRKSHSGKFLNPGWNEEVNEDVAEFEQLFIFSKNGVKYGAIGFQESVRSTDQLGPS